MECFSDPPHLKYLAHFLVEVIRKCPHLSSSCPCCVLSSNSCAFFIFQGVTFVEVDSLEKYVCQRVFHA